MAPAPKSDTELVLLRKGLQVRKASPASQYTPGFAAIDPTSINNSGVLALFGILSAFLVLASIWFFFWAKNGGFRFRQGDWDDYKSTVLRRKGPDGKTLSNATKRTVLSAPSTVADSQQSEDFASFAGEKPARKKKLKKNGRGLYDEKRTPNHRDNDVRAYRHEKPARVGGLNREADGLYSDYTATDPSDIATSRQHHRVSTAAKDQSTAREKKSRQFSYAVGTESTFSTYSDESSRPLQSSPAHRYHNHDSADSTPAHTAHHVRQPSPTKATRASSPTPKPRQSTYRHTVPGSYTDPIDFQSRYTASEADTTQSRNTKAYFHPIPELTGKAGTGFRRGRRDSLSDSEGETMR
ncbi:hypothetical protein MMC25_005398 [Agyrium rufum]|nr:hypothetical protein [Agyrium rufum]